MYKIIKVTCYLLSVTLFPVTFYSLLYTQVYIILPAYRALGDCLSEYQQEIYVLRDTVLGDLLERYKDETITQDHLCVEFLGESGVDTGGLTKELFTCFWSKASRNLLRGEHCLVPDLPLHRMRKESWKFVSLGRILSHMVALTGTIPHTLARSTFIKLATNSKVDDITLLEDFLLFVTPHERALLTKAMSSFSSLTEEESDRLLSLFSAHGYLDLPRGAVILEQILAIAEQELVQKPAHLTSLMHQGIPLCHRDAFWKHLSVGHITELMQSQKPTPERVAAVIASDKDDLTAEEDRTMYFLKEFVATLDSDSVMAFLIFVTGSMYQPDKITVTFNKLTGIQRRPVSHTCSNVLELPTSYHSCQDFRREFKQVLSSCEAFQFSMV